MVLIFSHIVTLYFTTFKIHFSLSGILSLSTFPFQKFQNIFSWQAKVLNVPAPLQKEFFEVLYKHRIMPARCRCLYEKLHF